MRTINLLCLLVAILPLINADCTECIRDEWSIVVTSGTPPQNIGGHTFKEYKGDFYVFGGFNESFCGSNTFYNKLYRLNTNNNKWRILDEGTGPSPRAFHASVNDRRSDKLVVFSGTTYNENQFFSNFTLYPDTWVWDLNNGGWHLANNGVGAPPARAQSGFTYLNGKMYVFGGVNEFFSATNDLWAFDFDTETWSQITPSGSLPPSRSAFVMEANEDQNAIYIFSGEGGADNGFAQLDDTWIYSVSGNTWSNITPSTSQNLNGGRTNFLGSALIDKRFVLFGGEGPSGAGGCCAPFDQDPRYSTWAFDTRPNKRTWKKLDLENHPPALKRHAGDNNGDCFYVHGGWTWDCETGVGQIPNNNVYVIKL